MTPPVPPQPDWPGREGLPGVSFRPDPSSVFAEHPAFTQNLEGRAPRMFWGDAGILPGSSPEGNVTGRPGDLFLNLDPAVAAAWIKCSGTDTTTGWEPLGEPMLAEFVTRQYALFYPTWLRSILIGGTTNVRAGWIAGDSSTTPTFWDGPTGAGSETWRVFNNTLTMRLQATGHRILPAVFAMRIKDIAGGMGGDVLEPLVYRFLMTAAVEAPGAENCTTQIALMRENGSTQTFNGGGSGVGFAMIAGVWNIVLKTAGGACIFAESTVVAGITATDFNQFEIRIIQPTTNTGVTRCKMFVNDVEVFNRLWTGANMPALSTFAVFRPVITSGATTTGLHLAHGAYIAGNVEP